MSANLMFLAGLGWGFCFGAFSTLAYLIYIAGDGDDDE